jgi:hypothetical protein
MSQKHSTFFVSLFINGRLRLPLYLPQTHTRIYTFITYNTYSVKDLQIREETTWQQNKRLAQKGLDHEFISLNLLVLRLHGQTYH